MIVLLYTPFAFCCRALKLTIIWCEKSCGSTITHTKPPSSPSHFFPVGLDEHTIFIFKRLYYYILYVCTNIIIHCLQ